ncbi:unnamed protein product [Trichogramma brassicae]|uniref:Uncharacterized protein n=1 Tax=Trichogramma brassicae TaxID=86971 RepID=A0A6H5IA62_9HYME|nr:unnamed protein product [Trichogramma brassicae]
MEAESSGGACAPQLSAIMCSKLSLRQRRRRRLRESGCSSARVAQIDSYGCICSRAYIHEETNVDSLLPYTILQQKQLVGANRKHAVAIIIIATTSATTTTTAAARIKKNVNMEQTQREAIREVGAAIAALNGHFQQSFPLFWLRPMRASVST